MEGGIAVTPICNPYFCRVLQGTVGVLWDTVGYCGVPWGTVGYCGVQWGYCGVLWSTVEYSGVPGTVG